VSLALFVDFLSNRRQRVTQNGSFAPWRNISKGVPQGSCLSPILFNIFIRLLPSVLNDPIFQFADDLTNSTTSNNITDLKFKLTENFNSIKRFCSKIDLTINASKTQCLLLKLPSQKIENQLELALDNHIIKDTNSVTLLGFTIDSHLTYRNHIENVVRKCHGLLGVLNRSKRVLTRNLMKLFYTAMIRPHLEYCSSLLSSASKTNLSKLDTIQKIASRIICNMPKDSHSEPLLDLLKLSSLSSRRQDKLIKNVHEILDKNCHPSFFNMFTSDNDGLLVNDVINRTNFGKKRFSIKAKEIYNSYILSD
jgi:ribonuclease P/MRP protein subunit RPP40